MAFHPYPQVIPQVFNPGGFGPPHRLTGASPCPWVDHSASGLQHATKAPCSDSLSLRLPHHGLTSPHTTTRRLILQKARHHTTPQQGGAGALTACRHMVSGTISQPLTGALFTFPSRYLSTIGHQGIFRLTTWSWQIHTEFHGLRATRDHPKGRHCGFAYRTLTVYGRPSQTSSATTTLYHSPPARQNQHRTIPQPRERNACRLYTRPRFSLIPFRSPLLRESHIVFFSCGY